MCARTHACMQNPPLRPKQQNEDLHNTRSFFANSHARIELWDQEISKEFNNNNNNQDDDTEQTNNINYFRDQLTAFFSG